MASVRFWGPTPRAPYGPTYLRTGPLGCRSMLASPGPRGSPRALLSTSGNSCGVRSKTSLSQ
eukprot:7392818-Lingulodinium_polyedra.AAC.1